MSYLDTKQALIQQLLTASGITNADIAFENKKFDPANKSFWLAAYFMPATTGILGKTSVSGDEQRGVFQVSVFTELNSTNFDNDQLTKIDTVLSAFQFGTSTVYNGQQVDILSSTVNNGTENESWFKRDISVNYLTFSER